MLFIREDKRKRPVSTQYILGAITDLVLSDLEQNRLLFQSDCVDQFPLIIVRTLKDRFVVELSIPGHYCEEADAVLDHREQFSIDLDLGLDFAAAWIKAWPRRLYYTEGFFKRKKLDPRFSSIHRDLIAAIVSLEGKFKDSKRSIKIKAPGNPDNNESAFPVH